MQAGYREYMEIHHKMNLPLLKTTAIVVAWTEEQLAALPGIVKQAHDNGVLDVVQIEAEEVYTREPNLAKGALGGVYVPVNTLLIHGVRRLPMSHRPSSMAVNTDLTVV